VSGCFFLNTVQLGPLRVGQTDRRIKRQDAFRTAAQ